MKTEHTAIDLFCGAGGLSEGFRQAGFRVLAGNDFNETAGETYAATHLDAKFLPGPIQDVTASRLLQASGLSKGELDCLIPTPADHFLSFCCGHQWKRVLALMI